MSSVISLLSFSFFCVPFWHFYHFHFLNAFAEPLRDIITFFKIPAQNGALRSSTVIQVWVMVTSHTQAQVKGLFNQLNFTGYFFETLKSNQHSYANQQQQRQQNGKLLLQSFTVISWSPSSTTTDVSSFPHGDVKYVLANSPSPTTWQNPDHPLWHSFDKLSCTRSICHINYTQTYSSKAATLILLPLSARTTSCVSL